MIIDSQSSLFWTCAALLAACCTGCSTFDQPQVEPDPNALHAFLERRALCDHLRGEIPDPGDPDATRDAAAAVNQYCAGSDAQLIRLKRMFAANAAVLKQLNALEACIETESACSDGDARNSF